MILGSKYLEMSWRKGLALASFLVMLSFIGALIFIERQRRQALSILEENGAVCEEWVGPWADTISRETPWTEIRNHWFVYPRFIFIGTAFRVSQRQVVDALAIVRPRTVMMTGFDEPFETDFLLRLGKISSIEDLELTASRAIDDHSIEFITKMHNLKTLLIQGTSVTDSVLPIVENCKSLRTLAIANTRVDAKKAAEFAAKRPEVEVYR